MSKKKKVVRKKRDVHIEVHLGYYKRGDDLGQYLSDGAVPIAALRMHAEQMESVSEHLNALADEIEKSKEKVEIDADTHFIGLTCSKELADHLIKSDLAEKSMFDEDQE
jgi:hypothetical protein